MLSFRIYQEFLSSFLPPPPPAIPIFSPSVSIVGGRHAKRVWGGGGGRLGRGGRQRSATSDDAVGFGRRHVERHLLSCYPIVSAECNLDSPEVATVRASVAGINFSALRFRGHRLARHAIFFSPDRGGGLRRGEIIVTKNTILGV